MALILAMMVVGFGWVVGQAAVYQVSQGKILSQRGERRVQGMYQTSGNRGKILDRTGRGSLAVTVPVPRVEFKGAPYFVDRTELGFALAEALGLNANEVIAKIIAEEHHALIKRNVTAEEAATVKQLGFPGIRIAYERRRFYPMGNVFGAEIGFVKDGRGNRGIEAQYDSLLKGNGLKWRVLRDSRKRRLYDSGAGRSWTLDGADLLLTIDARIQLALDSELSTRVDYERAVGGMAVVLDPHSFEVLAMSSIPSLDPNRYEEECGRYEKKGAKTDIGYNPCRNKVISYMFEPGSIAKIFSAAAAFDCGRLTPGSIVDGGNGRCKVGEHWISDLHRLERVPVFDAIKYSSNCAMAQVGKVVGAEILADTLRKFGFEGLTGIDLPGDCKGSLTKHRHWAETWAQAAAYGYGFKASLLQLAVATATIANNGMRLNPRLGLEARTPAGNVVERFESGEPVRSVSERAARMVKGAMTAVVMSEDGTGRRAKPVGYTAAGKTGTARLKWLGKHGRDKAYMTSFVGYAPASDPRIVVAVAIIDPREDKFGGSAAGPVFARVVEKALTLLGVEQDDPQETREAAWAKRF